MRRFLVPWTLLFWTILSTAGAQENYVQVCRVPDRRLGTGLLEVILGRALSRRPRFRPPRSARPLPPAPLPRTNPPTLLPSRPPPPPAIDCVPTPARIAILPICSGHLDRTAQFNLCNLLRSDTPTHVWDCL